MWVWTLVSNALLCVDICSFIHKLTCFYTSNNTLPTCGGSTGHSVSMVMWSNNSTVQYNIEMLIQFAFSLFLLLLWQMLRTLLQRYIKCMYDDCMLPLILFEVQVCSMYVANVLFSSMSSVCSEINSQFHAHTNVHQLQGTSIRTSPAFCGQFSSKLL